MPATQAAAARPVAGDAWTEPSADGAPRSGGRHGPRRLRRRSGRQADGEVCFNTAMTGYQEILTDPSYAGQIVTFTFPHIGNVGVNDDDVETVNLAATSGVRGIVVHAPITEPANYRATRHLGRWLERRGIVGICGVDTRALTALIRRSGMPNAVLAHDPDGGFDIEALETRARELPKMDGLDLVPPVTTAQRFDWDESSWTWDGGYRRLDAGTRHVVAIDYGVKRNILRLLADAGCSITVVPATASADEILALNPDGVFLSNGPGDPAATGEYAVPVIRDLLDRKSADVRHLPRPSDARPRGRREDCEDEAGPSRGEPPREGADDRKGRDRLDESRLRHRQESLPANAVETHVSLFDGSNCGMALTDRPAFSVQHHPEASPGPRDSHYLFERFAPMLDKRCRVSGAGDAANAS